MSHGNTNDIKGFFSRVTRLHLHSVLLVLLVLPLVSVRVCEDGRRPCVAPRPFPRPPEWLEAIFASLTHSSHRLYNDGVLDMWAPIEMIGLSLWRACCLLLVAHSQTRRGVGMDGDYYLT